MKNDPKFAKVRDILPAQNFFPARKIGIITLIIITTWFFTASTAAGDTPDTQGIDFWLAFPGNIEPPDSLALFITGDTNTTGTVSIPGLSFSQTFNVTANTVTTVNIPTTADLGTISDVITTKGIHVTAQQEVTVYGLNRKAFTTDAYLGLPSDILGTNYIALGYKNTSATRPGGSQAHVVGSQFVVVATENSTQVTITPSVTTGSRTAGVPYTINLNQGQAYQLSNTGPTGSDLSGSIITANKAIAVFGGHRCTFIPGGLFACDHVVEQLPPTQTWGKAFVTMPLATRLNGDTFRILASANSTEVSINGAIVATLNRGQLHEQIINGPARITATEPVLVAQYSNSEEYDGVNSDPFMMLIPPFEQFLGNYTLSTPASGFAQNFINVVAPNAAVGQITLDGVTIAPGNFTAIGSSGFSGAQVPIALGAHHLESNFPFGAFIYGFNSFDSYGYPGGASLAPVVNATFLTLTPETTANPVQTEQCFTATVTDQNNNPIEGLRVDFEASGVNSTSGFALTQANGAAQFCYTGLNPGEDTVTASSGDLLDTAAATWTATHGSVIITKFNDKNFNAIRELGEPGLAGWNFNIFDSASNSLAASEVTNANGQVLLELESGTYEICEVSQPDWFASTQAGLCQKIQLEAGQTREVNFGNFQAKIILEKSTNEEDADTPPGPEIPVNGPVTWTYLVKNAGETPLTNIEVTDDQLGAICDITQLDPDQTFTCAANGNAELGQYVNRGTATASAPHNYTVSDEDSSHYFGLGPGMWRDICTPHRMEVTGIGMGDRQAAINPQSLSLDNPATVNWVLAQMSGRLLSGPTVPGEVTFNSSLPQTLVMNIPTRLGGIPYTFETTLSPADLFTVEVDNTGGSYQTPRALTLYTNRQTPEAWTSVGRLLSEFVWIGQQPEYTEQVVIPPLEQATTISVTAVVIDNDTDNRLIEVQASAGGITQSVSELNPTHGEGLNIVELILEQVPPETNQIAITLKSPQTPPGDSVALVGVNVSYLCADNPNTDDDFDEKNRTLFFPLIVD